jgi:hypothetical protein
MFATFYSFSNIRGAGGGAALEVRSKPPGSLAGQPFAISDCSHAELRLCDWSETVSIDRCSDARILVGASCESVFLRNLARCTVTVACKQLRVRDCTDCTIYLSAKTEPVIEASSGLVFAPYNAACGGLAAAFRAAALQADKNCWDRVFDFSKDDAALPVPHWRRQGAWSWRCCPLGSCPTFVCVCALAPKAPPCSHSRHLDALATPPPRRPWRLGAVGD